jgi:uroporphyrinogen decarboxylase
MRKLTNTAVTLLGNIPPRDVLSAGAPEYVQNSVRADLNSLTDKTRIILSSGGGLPTNVPTENIDAFIAATTRGK